MRKLSRNIKKLRKCKIKKNQRGLKLFYNPQKKVICLKVQTMSPKKPNSANRRIAKVKILQKGTYATIKIPGEKHNLQQHSMILVCGGRSRDLIGVHLRAIRGKYDLMGVSGRKRARSIYGVKKS